MRVVFKGLKISICIKVRCHSKQKVKLLYIVFNRLTSLNKGNSYFSYYLNCFVIFDIQLLFLKNLFAVSTHKASEDFSLLLKDFLAEQRVRTEIVKWHNNLRVVEDNPFFPVISSLQC